jgi:hypothetical protein
MRNEGLVTLADAFWELLILLISQDILEQQGARSFGGNCSNKIKVEFLFLSNVYVNGNVTNNWHDPLRYIFKAIAVEEKLLDKIAQRHWDHVLKVDNHIESIFKWSTLVNRVLFTRPIDKKFTGE